MIVVLESRVEHLLRERGMVRRTEEDAQYLGMEGSSRPEAGQSTPRPRMLDALEPSNQDTTLTTLSRMPSFLSERSENTENLRNVYLGARGSILSLPRAPEESPDGVQGDLARIHSPSLSVLSESSLLGVPWSDTERPGGAAN